VDRAYDGIKGCKGCTFDGNTLGCWCLTGSDLYDTAWKTIKVDDEYNRISKLDGYRPGAAYTSKGQLIWKDVPKGKKIKLSNGQEACLAQKPSALDCTADGGTSISCSLHGQHVAKLDVRPLCRSSDTSKNDMTIYYDPSRKRLSCELADDVFEECGRKSEYPWISRDEYQ
jgi:hypothetical protein